MNQETKTPHVIAVTGGKGGVGKTSIAINLAIALSKSGSKVCLFDGDISLANTNIMLGLYPAYTLEHLFTGEKSIQDIVISGPEGIQIVPGASGFAHCAELDVGQQQRLVTSIKSIEKHYDYMLIDTAAGIGPTVLHFIAASQVAVIVITPEPTSLTDAFSLLKVLKRRGYRRRAQVVVNMAASPTQASKTFTRFAAAVQKYLGLKTEHLGSVWSDESMRNAVLTQKPVTLFAKTDPSARCFYRLAEKLETVFERPNTPTLPFSAYWQRVVERPRKMNRSVKTPAEQELLNKASVHMQSTPSSQADVPADMEHEPLTQVQKQLLAKVQQSTPPAMQTSTLPGPFKLRDQRNLLNTDDLRLHEDAIRVEEPTSSHAVIKAEYRVGEAYLPDSHDATLNSRSEDAWLDLRVRMNQFTQDPNTTPEQVVTLLSSALYGFGDRLGHAAVDLLHGLLHALDPETLTEEQKHLLLNDYARLGLDKLPSSQNSQARARYDEKGFGDQHALVEAIRSSAEDLPLESLLESIKYASLMDSGSG